MRGLEIDDATSGRMVALLCLAFAAGCPSGGGGLGDGGNRDGGKPIRGTLALTVSTTVDAGTAPSVRVSGSNYDQTFHATSTLQLPPGTYDILAQPLVSADPVVGLQYAATVTGSPASVSVGHTSAVSVSWASEPLPGTGHVWLPDFAVSGDVRAAPSSQLASTGTLAFDVVHPSGFGRMEGLALDASGRVWTADWTTSTIKALRFFADGGAVVDLTFESDVTLKVGDLAFSPLGDLWTVNYGASSLCRYSAADLANALDGGAAPTPVVFHSVLTDAGTDSLKGPTAIAFDAAGDAWVANVLGGTLVKLAVGTGPWLVTADGGVDAIPSVVVLPDNKSLSGPLRLAFDSKGKLWVSDTGEKDIFEIDPSGLQAAGVVQPLASIRNVDGGAPYLHGHAGGLNFDAAGQLWFYDVTAQALVQLEMTANPSGDVQPPAKVIVRGLPVEDSCGFKFDPPPPGLQLFP